MEKKRLALGVLRVSVVCLLPGVAFAQSGDGSWFPEPAPSEPAGPVPPEVRPAPPPSAEQPAALPAVPSGPLPPAEALGPPPPDRPFPVTFAVSDRSASMLVEGPGLEKPMPCQGRCALALAEGTYTLRIQTFRRGWSVPVVVHGRQRVDVVVPDRDLHATGVMLTVLGGTIVSGAGLFAYAVLLACVDRQQGGSPPLDECEGEPFIMDTLPWVLGIGGAGLALSGVGIGLIMSTTKPSVNVVSALATPTRWRDGTFIGLAPVAGGAGQGLLLRTAL